MTPVERAAELCRLRGGHFKEELELHLLRGFVFSTPDAFLMGRPMPRGADVSDLARIWPRAECDAWYVWLGVGRALALLEFMPYPLPWIGWYRQGRTWDAAHWVPTGILRSKLDRVRVST